MLQLDLVWRDSRAYLTFYRDMYDAVSDQKSRAPLMRHHGFKMARRVCGTYEMCNCFNLFF